jgi:hypothetical protein
MLELDCSSTALLNLNERRTLVSILLRFREVQGLNHFCYALLQFLQVVSGEGRSTLNSTKTAFSTSFPIHYLLIIIWQCLILLFEKIVK